MRRAAWALTLSILAVTPAAAGEREFRDQRKAFEDAIETLPPLDAEAEVLAAGEKKLQDALDGMFAEAPESATQYVVKDHLGSESYIDVKRRVLRKLSGLNEPRAVKALLRDYRGAKGELALLLTPVIAKLPGEEATQALARHLRARDDALVLAAVRGLGKRGAEAGDEAPKLERFLRDDSLSLRWAAAEALETITGSLPEGYARPEVDALGIPARVWSDHVVVLVDATREAGEADFVDPTASGEQKPIVSAYALVGQQWKAALQDKEPETLPRLALARFGRSADFYGRGYAHLRRPKELLELADWFDREPRQHSREVGDALEEAFRRDPPPEEVFLFLAGLPSGRQADAPLAVVERLEALTFGRPVTVHVTAFVLEPAVAPVGEQGKAALAAQVESLRSFTSKLAAVTGGRSTVVELARPSAEDAASGGAGPELEPLAVDLTKPIPTREFRQVEARWKSLLEADPLNDPQRAQLEAIAACPEPKVGELVLEALRWRRPEHARAVARGVARNPAPQVHAAVHDALAEEKDPARQLLLVRAYGAAPGQDVTEGLLDRLEGLTPDARRAAWILLAERPDTELAAAKSLKRAARDLNGVAGFHASIALSRASGQPSPSTSGLQRGGKQLLPTRFIERGVAFLVDTHKDMGDLFKTFPPAAPAEGETEPGPAPPPASKLVAVQDELTRALGAVQTATGQANVVQLDGRSLFPRAEQLDAKSVQGAEKYVARLKTGSHRDVWAAVQQALDDPSVEVIHLLVSGLPLRSPAGSELRELIATANRARGVPIHVVVVAGPIPESNEAAHMDFVASLEAQYQPIAEDSGGTYGVCRELPALEPAKR